MTAVISLNEPKHTLVWQYVARHVRVTSHGDAEQWQKMALQN